MSLRRTSRDAGKFVDSDFDFSPDVSPDGTRIVFMTLRFSTATVGKPTRRFDIVTSDIDGSSMQRLTEGEGSDASPVWSPDGSEIAFLSDRDKGFGTFGLFLMSADGSDVRAIAPEIRAYGPPPVWSPDGRQLAFQAVEESDVEGERDRVVLYTVRAGGSDTAMIVVTGEFGRTDTYPEWSDAAWPSLPTWSPDSSQIAYETVEGIFISNDDGSNEQRVTVSGGSPYWSADGSWIYHMGDSGLTRVRVDGSNMQVLADVGERGGIFSLSPDGTRVAVRRNVVEDDSVSEVVLFTVASDGSDMRVLVRKGLSGILYAGNREKPLLADEIDACSDGSIVPNPEDNLGLVQDCETLLRVRDTLAGDDVILNWSSNERISNWVGVSFLEGRVSDIWLKGLNGSIPPEIGDLDGLGNLRLYGDISGPIPAEIGMLQQLTLLWIGGQLSGQIPPELGNLVNLRSLQLGNGLTGSIPSELGNLSKVEFIGVRGNNLTGCMTAEVAAKVGAYSTVQNGGTLEPC